MKGVLYFALKTMHKRTLIAIGYWFSDDEPELPKPHDFIDTTISSSERQQLVDYLKNGKRLHEWMGFSRCRFGCRLPVNEIGNACLTDGIYIWPEGLPHYSIEHQVWLPDTFVSHVNHHFPLNSDKVLTDESNFGNYDWWKGIKTLHERTT